MLLSMYAGIEVTQRMMRECNLNPSCIAGQTQLMQLAAGVHKSEKDTSAADRSALDQACVWSKINLRVV